MNFVAFSLWIQSFLIERYTVLGIRLIIINIESKVKGVTYSENQLNSFLDFFVSPLYTLTSWHVECHHQDLRA